MLYKVALTFESVDEIHKFDHWDESYWAALSCGTAYYALQVCSKEGYWAELSCGVVDYEVQGGPVLLLSLWIKSYGETIQIKAYKQYFPMVLYKCILYMYFTRWFNLVSLWMKS